MTSPQLRSGLRRLTALALWGVLLHFGSAIGQDRAPEDAVKAAFLYRFTHYSRWPRPTEGSFEIAVLGQTPVARELARIVEKRPIHNVPTRVLTYTSPQEITRPQLLYISADYAGDVRAVIRTWANEPVLIVTDRSDGLQAGGTINFFVADRRVRFEVSVSAAERSGIFLSSELLSVAARVIGAEARVDGYCDIPQGQRNSSCLNLVAIQ